MAVIGNVLGRRDGGLVVGSCYGFVLRAETLETILEPKRYQLYLVAKQHPPIDADKRTDTRQEF